MNLIAPRFFGLIHCPIGPLEDVVLTGVVFEKENHADTRRAVVLDDFIRLAFVPGSQTVRFGQTGTYLLGDEHGP